MRWFLGTTIGSKREEGCRESNGPSLGSRGGNGNRCSTLNRRSRGNDKEHGKQRKPFKYPPSPSTHHTTSVPPTPTVSGALIAYCPTPVLIATAIPPCPAVEQKCEALPPHSQISHLPTKY